MPERRGYIQKDFWQLVLELQKTAELPALRKRQRFMPLFKAKLMSGQVPTQRQLCSCFQLPPQTSVD